MSKYLIEVQHKGDKIECQRTVSIFLSSGSHFLTNADWGCLDGEHKCWFFMDAGSKDEAIQIVPPAFRKDTRIILLSKFKLKDFEELLRHHDA
jgi:hypothetical protein